MILCETEKQRREKTQKAAKKIISLLLFVACNDHRKITFRDFRVIQSTSCGHEHGEKPIRDDHSLLPYARGNHACLRDDDCEAEMFFSFSNYLFCYYFADIHTPSTRAGI
jgi:hypothetical protein